MTVSISSGHSASYLTDAVAAGRENYYTGAVAAGEPPGRWSGRGAAALGLAGEVDAQDMTALYERFLDPHDGRFKDPLRWDEAERDGATLGHTGRKYKTEDEIYAKALAKEPGADAERRAALRVEAGKRARKNVAFLDATFSVQKSVTVLHTAFEAQEVRARSAAEQARAALHALTGAPSAANDGSAPDGADMVHQSVHQSAQGPVQTPTTVALTPRQRREADRLTAEIVAAEAEAASWSTYRQAVEDAIWAGNQAALSYLSDKAGYARVGHHGGSAGRWVDAHDWTIASFFQHDSRDRDPQLHIHNAILNRVEGDDGKWRTIDAKAIYRYRGAAGSVGERVMEQHLTRALGVRFAMRPDGKAREVVGIDQAVMDLFSSRRRAITRKTAKLVTAFETKFGRSPNSLELDRLQRQATFASRRAKSHEGETVAQRLERWDSQLRAEVSGGLRQVADQVMSNDTRQARPVARWKASEVIETALADVQETKSAWTAPDLTRAIGNALPDDLGDLRPEQVTRLLDRLTEEALKLAVPLDAQRPGEQHLPDQLRLADGTSAYESRGARLYATPAHIHTERLLKAAAADRTAPAMPAAAVDQLLAELSTSGVGLGADQAAAVRGILTSGATVETLVGPAGTGKSFVVGTIARAWEDPAAWDRQGTRRLQSWVPRLTGRRAPQRRVVALAASQIATEVLAGEGLTARNITQWLAAQQRLAEATQSGTDPAGQDRAWELRSGDLVVVDESAMANTTDLARIHTHCTAVGAKLLLVGDHRQLAAVGAAGAMEMIAEHSIPHELAETRRFQHTWEGPASLRLRDRDETALAEYHKHGRLLDCGAMEQAEASAARAWLADTLRAKHSLLIVDTNEQAARLSARIRTDLVRLGLVGDDQRVALGLQGTFAGDGDIVQARRNAWDLAGYAGNRRGPINREQYRVLEVLDNGDLKVATITGRRDLTGHGGGRIAYELGEYLTLPAAYVEQHLALGYASTVHAAQGLTVDTAHTVATGATSAEALYVAMSRARERNTAHVVTEAIPADAPIGLTKTAIHRSPQAVLAGAFDTADPHLSALAEASRSEAEAGTVRAPAELFADAAQIATADRTSRWLDELVDHGSLTPAQRTALAAEDGTSTLTTLLRRVELAGHDPRQVLTAAVERRTLDDARQITNVIHRRITETTSLDPVGDTYTDWIPQVDDPRWRTYLESLAAAADERRRDLAEQAAIEQPQWAIEALGEPAPAGSEKRRCWIAAIAAAAAHRELVGHDDDADAIGPAPKPGQAEAYASWRAAWRALGRPEAERAEAEMSDGQLRVRIRAYEREASWAPAYVANELAGTRQAAAKHRQDAAVRRAEADNPTGNATTDEVDGAAQEDADAEEQRARRLQEAAQADALAEALEARAAELAEADEARAHWYAHTAETRAAADRARAELSARESAGQLTRDDEAALTAEEWLAVDQTAAQAEDPHREITAEHEVTDIEAQREHDQTIAATRQPLDEASQADRERSTPRRPDPREAEPAPLDIRQRHQADLDNSADLAHSAELAAERRRSEDEVRVPTANETAAAVRRAQGALAELRQRQRHEQQRAADEARDEQLAQWHADDDREHEQATQPSPAAPSHAASADLNADTATVAADTDTGGEQGPVLDRTR